MMKKLTFLKIFSMVSYMAPDKKLVQYVVFTGRIYRTSTLLLLISWEIYMEKQVEKQVVIT